jgi:putative ABC transport system permease protein
LGVKTDRRMRLELAWASLRWRLGVSVAMLLVAISGIAVGTFGPCYLHGADQSVLKTTLGAAPASNIGISVLSADGKVPPAQLLQVISGLPRSGSGGPLFGAPIVTADLPISTTSPNGSLYRADLLSRTGACAHLSFVSGTCPRRTRSVALSERSAQALGLRSGDDVDIMVGQGHSAVSLRIAGIFRTANPQSPYWWGVDYFPFGASPPPFASPHYELLDDFFTTQSNVLALARPATSQVSYLAEAPLSPDEMATTAIPYANSAIAQFETRISVAYGLNASTQLPAVLAAVAGEERTTSTIVSVVLLQLVLLSLMVLYFVAVRTAESRITDVRLAEMRGAPRSQRALLVLLEPVALLILALPLGIGAAWLAVTLLAPHLFAGNVSTSVTSLTLLAAVVTFGGGVLATVLGARRLLLRRENAWGALSTEGGRAAALAFDAVAVAFAGAAFVEVSIAGVASGSQTDVLAATAPGLLALAAGIIGARLLPVGGRLALARTRHSHRVGIFLAIRRLARRPHISRQVIVVSVAVSVAVFTVAGWIVATNNRSLRAQFTVGSAEVLDVKVPSGVNFVQAVRRADAGRHEAMAVAVESASDGATLAVDAPELPAVASWPEGMSPKGVATISRELSPPTGPAVDLSGQNLQVTVAVGSVVTPAPGLSATVFDDATQTVTTLSLGALAPGQRNYRSSIVGPCTPACRLVDLGLTWTPLGNSPQQSVRVALLVRGLATQSSAGMWSPVRAHLGMRGAWASSTGGVTFDPNSEGLGIKATVDADGATTSVGPQDVPAALPAVITGTGAGTGGPNLGVGLDGSTIDVQPIASVNALPGVGAGPIMVDLTLAERLQSGPMQGDTLQVWLSGPDRRVVQSLKAQGLSITSVSSTSERDTTLSRTGVSYAYDMFVLAAIAAVALAVGSTLFSVVVSVRRRVGELSALRAVGVPPSPLRRSIMVEHGSIVCLGVVLGCITGVISAAVALPTIPEFGTGGSGPPLSHVLPLGALVITGLCAAAALALTVIASTHAAAAAVSADRAGREEE